MTVAARFGGTGSESEPGGARTELLLDVDPDGEKRLRHVVEEDRHVARDVDDPDRVRFGIDERRTTSAGNR
jgi:hypothetical protein